MNYEDAKKAFDNMTRYGSILGLENIKLLLAKLGNPEKKLRVVHVAGTNGKGSTIAYIATILKTAGYKVGVYTSPVVFDYLEKIKINDEFIKEEDFAACALSVLSGCDEVYKEYGRQITVFEAETALAMEYFCRKECNIVIIETGMGGRDDATNVFDSILCAVITSISMDHMAYLGDSIEKIAYAKAGIILEDCEVVVQKNRSKAIDIEKVIYDEAKLKKAMVCMTEEALSVMYNQTETTFSYRNYHDLCIHLLGSFQIDNACTAIDTIEILRKHGYQIDDKAIYKGLTDTVWKGRFERLHTNPDIYIDGGHNPGAAIRLKESIDLYFSGRKIVYVMGVLADKDYREIVNILLRDACYIVTLTPHNKRGLDGQILADTIYEVNNRVEYVSDYRKAISVATSKAIEEDAVIFVFGSLSYLNDIRKEIN